MTKIYKFYILPLILILFFLTLPKKYFFNDLYKDKFEHLNGIKFQEKLERNYYIYNNLIESDSNSLGIISQDCSYNDNEEIKIIDYVVKENDKLTDLAKKYNQDLEVIKFNNPQLNKDSKIKEGQKLVFYSKNGIFYNVKRNDNLYRIAKIYRVRLEDIIMHNDLSGYKILPGQKIFIPKPRFINQKPKVDHINKNPNLVDKKETNIVKKETNIIQSLKKFLWPIKWRGVSSSFGMRIHPVLKVEMFHKGIDLKAPKGTEVYAPMDGRVIHAKYQRGFGNLITVRHDNGYITRFGHLNKIFVSENSRIKAGDKIAETGATGICSAPHLHFEVINEKGEYLNPENLRKDNFIN